MIFIIPLIMFYLFNRIPNSILLKLLIFPIIVFLISKFFELWKPSAIFLVDSEIWPNLIIKAKKNKTPIAIINARLTKKTFKKWMLIPKSAKSIFSTFKLCLSSNIESKNYLSYLDVNYI